MMDAKQRRRLTLKQLTAIENVRDKIRFLNRPTVSGTLPIQRTIDRLYDARKAFIAANVTLTSIRVEPNDSETFTVSVYVDGTDKLQPEAMYVIEQGDVPSVVRALLKSFKR